jgi:hypothetical protein
MPDSVTSPVPSLGWVTLACAVGVAVGYTMAVDPVISSASQLLYPLVWLGVSAGALWFVRSQLPTLGPAALVIGAGYALVLLWSAGLLAGSSGSIDLAVHLGVPGWGPALVYDGAFVRVTLIPFLVVGYATLGLLAAVAVDHLAGAATAGVVGLFACVSCTAPLLAGLATSLGAGSIAATLSGAAYPLATAAFLLSVGVFVGLASRQSAAG